MLLSLGRWGYSRLDTPKTLQGHSGAFQKYPLKSLGAGDLQNSRRILLAPALAFVPAVPHKYGASCVSKMGYILIYEVSRVT